MNKGFLILFLLYCVSCGSNSNLNFKNNRRDYENAIKCLKSNYVKILSPDSIKYAISVLHKGDLDKLDSCPDLKLLFNQEPLDFIVIKEDSTIYFYSKPSGGSLRSKQNILLYYNKGTIQNLQLSTDLKLIKEIDTSWYQLERITSLAD